jgi:hypothetical protein
LILFGMLYLGRIALIYGAGFLCLAELVAAFVDQFPGLLSVELERLFAFLSISMPIMLGMYITFIAYRRKALGRYSFFVMMGIGSCAILVSIWIEYFNRMYLNSSFTWFILFMAVCNTFALGWVPLMLHRQRYR